MLIFWVNKEYPKTVLATSGIEGGKHKGFLQPGTYIPYLFRFGDGVPLDGEITITDKDKNKVLEPIVVTKELWSKKKSLHGQGIR